MTAPPEHPFALWTIFYGIHRWFLAPGCPPTLLDERRWVRALRASVLLGTLGYLSSWVTTLWSYFERRFLSTDIASETWILVQGLWFGLFVAMPLARWLGREKRLSNFGVLVAIAAFYAAALLHNVHPQFGLLIGVTCGAGLLGLWFVDPQQPRTWWLVPITLNFSYVAIMLCGFLSQSVRNARFLAVLSEFDHLLEVNALFAPLHTLIAVALGFRLWWDAPPVVNHPSPRPAANTAETSTANPVNHTDVAVSPDLNSP